MSTVHVKRTPTAGRMKLHATCPCGATFTYEASDGRDHYINGGGHPDAKGRVFSIQVTFDEWRDAHKNHTASLLKDFFHGS